MNDAEASAAPADQEFNDDDVMFAQGMIPHHAQAVEMASIALETDRATSDQVRDLARRIQSAQDPEIEQMTEWLTSWEQPLDMPAMDGMEMDGMVASDDLDALAALDGDDFDAEWTRLMIAHHEGAISMAEDEIAGGLNTEVIALAENIVTTQQAEIEEMR
ncbi:DUF305 domain-containing protein [Rubrivirga sp.]|uniref:DUF305 domain-containing protein n=1 Tax=Rubrivirga sp. TaxID=1885344 RepID=UPI003C711142